MRVSEVTMSDFQQRERVLNHIGWLNEEFRFHRANLLAASMIGGVVSLAGGTWVAVVCTLPMPDIVEPDKTLLFALPLAVGCMAIFAGLAGLAWSWDRSFYRMLICSNGFAEQTWRKLRAWRWDEVTKVEEVEETGIISLGKSRTKIILTLKDGDRIDVQPVNKLERLVRMLREDTAAHSIPWSRGKKWKWLG